MRCLSYCTFSAIKYSDKTTEGKRISLAHIPGENPIMVAIPDPDNSTVNTLTQDLM